MFSLIHLRTAGSAYKLSTGMSKKPWIWLACRSIVIMWSAPDTWWAPINFALAFLVLRGILSCWLVWWYVLVSWLVPGIPYDYREHVGHELGRDWSAGFVLLVLPVHEPMFFSFWFCDLLCLLEFKWSPCIWKAWNNGGDLEIENRCHSKFRYMWIQIFRHKSIQINNCIWNPSKEAQEYRQMAFSIVVLPC